MVRENHSPTHRKRRVDSKCRQYSGRTRGFRLAHWSMGFLCSVISSSKVINYKIIYWEPVACLLFLSDMNAGEEEEKSINNQSKHVGGHCGSEGHGQVWNGILKNNSLCQLILLLYYFCPGDKVWFGLDFEKAFLIQQQTCFLRYAHYHVSVWLVIQGWS